MPIGTVRNSISYVPTQSLSTKFQQFYVNISCGYENKDHTAVAEATKKLNYIVTYGKDLENPLKRIRQQRKGRDLSIGGQNSINIAQWFYKMHLTYY